MTAVVQFRGRQFAERLICCSEISQKTEYPGHNTQEFSVGAEFVYFKEGGRECILLELGGACSVSLE